jgi:hypothetical protein
MADILRAWQTGAVSLMRSCAHLLGAFITVSHQVDPDAR